jgi:hypothetical protein
MAVDRRLLLKCLTLAVMLMVALSSQVRIAAAAAPVIVSIENDTRPTMVAVPVAVKLTINYVPSSPGGYVDRAEVNYDGTVQTDEYPIDKSIQTTNPFTVRLEIGMAGAPHTASVRVHSTADGWSNWTSTIDVPEFPMIAIATFITLVMSLLVIRYSRNQTYHNLSGSG